jgi:hypothetical protein
LLANAFSFHVLLGSPTVQAILKRDRQFLASHGGKATLDRFMGHQFPEAISLEK